jgi:hypothetical protein
MLPNSSNGILEKWAYQVRRIEKFSPLLKIF